MSSIRVELDLYSGRPNPTWDLSADAAQMFFQLINTLPQATTPPSKIAVQGGLGYRGLKVDVFNGTRAAHIEISRGNVSVKAAGSTSQRHLSDPDRSFEKWLLQTGSDHLGQELLDYLKLEISGNSAAT